MECIPAIDLSQGRVVRLAQGDFARRSDYAVEPAALAERYADAGARRLHVVDLDGAAGDGGNRNLVRRLCAIRGLEIQVGGGVRDEDTLAALFAAGAAAVVIGSLAVRDAARVRTWLARFGGERLVLAFDVQMDDDGIPEVRTDAWRRSSGLSLWELVQRYRDAGLRKLLCTDVSRDGLLQGPNLELYKECLGRFPEFEWQASGGVGGPKDLSALAEAGVPAAIVGRALLEGRVDTALLGHSWGRA